MIDVLFAVALVLLTSSWIILATSCSSAAKRRDPKTAVDCCVFASVFAVLAVDLIWEFDRYQERKNRQPAPSFHKTNPDDRKEKIVMAATSIEWADFTFNPWEGCSKVHAGCANCYAEVRAERFGTVKWGPNGTRRVTSPANWKNPLRWNAQVGLAMQALSPDKPRHRPRVFCASLADVFEDWRGPLIDSNGHHLVHANGAWEPKITEQHESCSRVTMVDVRAELFKLIDATPHLDWLLLTKRPENIRRMWPIVEHSWENDGERCVRCGEKDWRADDCCVQHRRNVWLLTSVSDQASADKMIPEQLKCRDLTPVLGLSCEPLLGPLNLHQWFCKYARGSDRGQRYSERFCDPSGRIDWIIAGGESGPNARPMHLDWARSLRDQCNAAGVPFFFKQWGEWAPAADAGPIGAGVRVVGVDQLGDEYSPGDYIAPEANVITMARAGKKAAGRLLDGVEHNGAPRAISTEVSNG